VAEYLQLTAIGDDGLLEFDLAPDLRDYDCISPGPESPVQELLDRLDDLAAVLRPSVVPHPGSDIDDEDRVGCDPSPVPVLQLAGDEALVGRRPQIRLALLQGLELVDLAVHHIADVGIGDKSALQALQIR